MKRLVKLIILVFLLLNINVVNAEVKWNYIKSPKYVSKLIDEYNKIPEKARNIYDNNNLVITIYGYNYYPNYIGLYDGKVSIESYKKSNLKSFYRRRRVSKSLSISKLSENYSKMALIHELGHAYDYKSGLISKSSEFISIYNSEKSKFKKTSFYKYPMGKVKENISNSQEYFASSFAAFIMARNDLKKKCPKTYEYLLNELYN